MCVALFIIGYYKLEDKNDDKLTKVTVAEVTHSFVYAPWYVALEKGYFKDEGLDIDLTLTPGADKVAAAVLSDDAQIGLAGAEASIYVYNKGEKDYLKGFAACVKRDGQFIVGKCNKDFKLKDLEGKSVLAGRVGGMPLMNFRYALKNAGVSEKNIDINTSVDFASLAGAYIGKQADFVNLFEPNATALENEEYGCVLDSIGKYAGEVPYTVFSARKSYIEKNEKIIRGFDKALNKGLKFVRENDAKVIAKAIYKQFPDNSMNEIITIVNRYKENDSWSSDTFIKEEHFNRLLEIMKYNDALDKEVPYDKLVTNINE